MRPTAGKRRLAPGPECQTLRLTATGLDLKSLTRFGNALYVFDQTVNLSRCAINLNNHNGRRRTGIATTTKIFRRVGRGLIHDFHASGE